MRRPLRALTPSTISASRSSLIGRLGRVVGNVFRCFRRSLGLGDGAEGVENPPVLLCPGIWELVVEGNRAIRICLYWAEIEAHVVLEAATVGADGVRPSAGIVPPCEARAPKSVSKVANLFGSILHSSFKNFTTLLLSIENGLSSLNVTNRGAVHPVPLSRSSWNARRRSREVTSRGT
jgi:hypothetical protein